METSPALPVGFQSLNQKTFVFLQNLYHGKISPSLNTTIKQGWFPGFFCGLIFRAKSTTLSKGRRFCWVDIFQASNGGGTASCKIKVAIKPECPTGLPG